MRDIDKLDNTDVLFIMPPYIRFSEVMSWGFPLGLGYIVSYLKQFGITSYIYNADYYKPIHKNNSFFTRIKNRIIGKMKHVFGYREADETNNDFSQKFTNYFKIVTDKNHPIWDEYRYVIRTCQPRIIGISSKVIDIPSVLMMAEITKKIDSSIKIIVGGPSATTCEDILMNNKNIDYLVLNEGEETAYELIDFLLNNNRDLRTIQGIVYRDGAKIIKTPVRPLIEHLDILPFPDRDSMFIINNDGNIEFLHQNQDILTTRGCPYPCKFCACYTVWGNRIPRSRSVDNIIDELVYLKTTYQQEFFIFWDDLFAVNKARVFELCNRIIALNLNIRWLCFLRINNIEKDLLDILKRAGCVEIQIGIESGNNRMLKYVGKQITVEQIKEKMPIIKESGINWLAFLIIGFPTETIDEIGETMHFINEIKPNQVCVSIFSPYRGTEFYEMLVSNKTLKGDFLMSDTLNVHTNYTGTMTNKMFSTIAQKALKFNDEYNEDNTATWS